MFSDVKILKARELPGAETWNVVAKMLRNFKVGQGLYLHREADGSLALEMEPSGGGAVNAGFFGSISNGALTISAGKVFLPESVLSLSKVTHSVSNGRHYYVEISKNGSTYSATMQYDSSYPSPMLDKSTLKLCYPLLNIASGRVRHAHIGDIIITALPYFWLDNYAGDAAQSLDHDANGALRWNTYGECQQQ
ncbi:MAG: hypothetical protein IJS08_09000 [Victivallales bacterium]|nr:hypothetical protein [Victivallales bacterium]